MNRFYRLGLLAAIVLATFAMMAPALATEDTGGEEEQVTTTTIADPFADGEAPAIVIPPVEVEEEEQPWTARFIYPAIVIGTIILIIGLIIGYNRSIRHRYKVVAD
ncbi:MAG: hypothetical protein ACR2N2_04120 [Acidimicrobiia bacterium]